MPSNKIKRTNKIALSKSRRLEIDPYQLLANYYFSDIDEFFTEDNMLPRDKNGVIILDPKDPKQKAWYQE